VRPLPLIVLAASVVAAAPAATTAATIRIPDDQPTIQAGINAASYGDTVLVECGTYTEHDIEMRSGIVLRSETGLADCVTIDAQQQGRVLYFDGVDSQTHVLGMTVIGGLTYEHGAGMYCISSSPTLKDCTFEGNEGDWGQQGGCGMYCNDSTLTLVGCTFSANLGASGAGLACVRSSAEVTNCTFSGNESHNWGGGGVHCYLSNATFTNCTFSENHTYYDGGGMMCEQSSVTLTGCLLEENQAFWGGGIMCWSCSPELTGCTFKGNQATSGGGIICRYADAHPTLTDCIIAFSMQGGAAACQFESAISLTCCDVYGNAGGDWSGCIADQYGVDSNFSEDPLFCLDDNPEEPCSLHEGSPCLPENSPCDELVGAFGQGCSTVTAVEAVSWSSVKALYR
jgi:hypothetical protein